MNLNNLTEESWRIFKLIKITNTKKKMTQNLILFEFLWWGNTVDRLETEWDRQIDR